MIKLIASDMDGTLLDSHHNLPPDFDEVFSRLMDRGVHFVVASGRSLSGLKPYLGQMPGAPACICDNGAFVMTDGQVSGIRAIPRDCLNRLIRTCGELDGVKLVLCGVRGSYFLEDGSEFSRMASSFYDNHQATQDFYSVDDTIFKVGLSDLVEPDAHSLPYLQERLGDVLSIRVSGRTWMDITDREVTKGSALHGLQMRLGIAPEETMAFGDNYNDIELWANAQYSFVMENADHNLRRYGSYLAKSNREYGVTQAIRQFVLI